MTTDNLKIDKLPKWAQQHIKDISRQRDVAIDALNKYVDNQTEAPFYISEMECTGENKGPAKKTRYIQGHWLNATHQGVKLSVLLRDDHIDISWDSEDRKDIAMVPASHQQVRLYSKENMR